MFNRPPSVVLSNVRYECWAEFSIDDSFCEKLSEASENLAKSNKSGGKFVKPGRFHISLLYGYAAHESDKLLEIVRKHMCSPIKLTTGEIKRGDISPVILIKVAPSVELNEMFMELYEAVGQKKHSLIDGKYDPHITLAISDAATLDQMDLNAFKDALSGQEITINTVFSMDENDKGENIELGKYQVSLSSLKQRL